MNKSTKPSDFKDDPDFPEINAETLEMWGASQVCKDRHLEENDSSSTSKNQRKTDCTQTKTSKSFYEQRNGESSINDYEDIYRDKVGGFARWYMGNSQLVLPILSGGILVLGALVIIISIKLSHLNNDTSIAIVELEGVEEIIKMKMNGSILMKSSSFDENLKELSGLEMKKETLKNELRTLSLKEKEIQNNIEDYEFMIKDLERQKNHLNDFLK